MPETPSTQPSVQPKSFFLGPDLHDYILNHGGGPDEVQQALMAATQALGPVARMQIAPEQGVFMEWLARVMGARQAIEVGTFTGYSALCLARGLGPQGHLLCLDVNEAWTRIAQTYWRKAGLADRITLRLGPAAAALATLSPGAHVRPGLHRRRQGKRSSLLQKRCWRGSDRVGCLSWITSCGAARWWRYTGIRKTPPCRPSVP